VKLLDFGLAKAITEDTSDQSNSPMLSLAMTSAGMILGTAVYMAPEQARGKQVDRRADIWAFGLVLLETLTGRQAYTGDTIADTLAKVLTQEPALDALSAETPTTIRTLIRSCLQKDPARRLSWIVEARRVIDAGTEELKPFSRDFYNAVSFDIAGPQGTLVYRQGNTPDNAISWLEADGSVTLDKAVDANACPIRDAANRGTDMNFRRIWPEIRCLSPVCPTRRHPAP